MNELHDLKGGEHLCAFFVILPVTLRSNADATNSAFVLKYGTAATVPKRDILAAVNFFCKRMNSSYKQRNFLFRCLYFTKGMRLPIMVEE